MRNESAFSPIRPRLAADACKTKHPELAMAVRAGTATLLQDIFGDLRRMNDGAQFGSCARPSTHSLET